MLWTQKERRFINRICSTISYRLASALYLIVKVAHRHLQVLEVYHQSQNLGHALEERVKLFWWVIAKRRDEYCSKKVHLRLDHLFHHEQ